MSGDFDYAGTKVRIIDRDTGQEIEHEVPYGGGLAEPDRDDLYCHLWENGRYYKYPEKPENDFRGLIAPQKMFLFHATSETMALQANQIRISEDLIRIFAAAQVPDFVWGPFGVGKTKFSASFQEERDNLGRYYHTASIELSTVDPTVIQGIRYTAKDRTGATVMLQSIPDLAQEVVSVYRETGRLTVVLMDEFTLCSDGQQGAALSFFTDGKMGPLYIGLYIAMIVASNPKGTVKGVRDLGEQVMNRGAHIAWLAEPDVWYRRWARGWVPEWENSVPEREPELREKRFARHLLDNPPQGTQTFRSSWDTKPWDGEKMVPVRLDMTPRSLTMFLTTKAVLEQAIDDFNATNADRQVPNEIRQQYLTLIANALLGTKWGSKVAEILLLEESDFLGFEEMLERSRLASWDTLGGYTDDLMLAGRGSSRRLLESAELQEAMVEGERIISRAETNADDRTRALLVFWLMLHDALRHSDINDQEWIAEKVANVVQLLGNRPELREGMPTRLTPPFVSDEVKERVSRVLSARR